MTPQPDPSAHDPITALLDGELSESEAQQVIDTLLKSPQMQAQWHEHHRVADWVQSPVVLETSAQFMVRFEERLRAEPIPLPRRSGRFQRPHTTWWLGSALAASVLVAVALGLNWLSLGNDEAAPVLASSSTVLEAPTINEEALRAYVAAHQGERRPVMSAQTVAME